jgi:hypothetical protein
VKKCRRQFHLGIGRRWIWITQFSGLISIKFFFLMANDGYIDFGWSRKSEQFRRTSVTSK